MDFMDYNYFNSGAHSYPYLGLEVDPNKINAGMGPIPTLETVEPVTFPMAQFDFQAFDQILGPGLGTEQLSESSSPPEQHLSSFLLGSVNSGNALDLDNAPNTRRGSSEEKDNLTPAQSRRKAQNRAAQRAFRERKERHVRDLEAKLNLLTTTTSSLKSDNERLKLLLHKIQTENAILRARVPSSSARLYPPGFVDDPSLLPPSRQSQESPEPDEHATQRSDGVLSTSKCSRGRHGSSRDSESNLLSASAAWELIQSHPLYLTGAVDIGEVCERLKKLARSGETGSMFDENTARKAIEEVGRSASGELM